MKNAPWMPIGLLSHETQPSRGASATGAVAAALGRQGSAPVVDAAESVVELRPPSLLPVVLVVPPALPPAPLPFVEPLSVELPPAALPPAPLPPAEVLFEAVFTAALPPADVVEPPPEPPPEVFVVVAALMLPGPPPEGSEATGVMGRSSTWHASSTRVAAPQQS